MPGIFDGQSQVVLASKVEGHLNMVRGSGIDDISRQRAVGTASLPCVSIAKNAGPIFVDGETVCSPPFHVDTCRVTRMKGRLGPIPNDGVAGSFVIVDMGWVADSGRRDVMNQVAIQC